MTATNGKTGAALAAALDRLSYEYLSTHMPDLVIAIDRELGAGATPESIKFVVLRHVGADRDGLALRCEQTARYMAMARVA